MSQNRFFSIVVPAHKEEGYVGDTLKHINSIDYPRDLFEAIVIENGSEDATLKEASHHESDVVKVLSTKEKGVSIARNIGIKESNPNADWVIFLDADTHFAPHFLKDLNKYLDRPEAERYSFGSTSILPFGNDNLKARVWFKLYDFGHWFAQNSYSMFMVHKRVIEDGALFDETMSIAEDIKMMKTARKHGKYFFFRTNAVSTSTRRFDKQGWWIPLIVWVGAFPLPESVQRRINYTVVR